jgi:hypothetical protein
MKKLQSRRKETSGGMDKTRRKMVGRKNKEGEEERK